MNMQRQGAKELPAGGVKGERCGFLETENGCPSLISTHFA
jgi:hypothetical protein